MGAIMRELHPLDIVGDGVQFSGTCLDRSGLADYADAARTFQVML